MNQLTIPNPETRKHSGEKMREICRQYDALNLILDEAISLAEAEIRNSPLNAYRLKKAKLGVVPESNQLNA